MIFSLIRDKYLKEEIPEVLESLKLIKSPINFNDTINIYRWLFDKQITFDIIPEDVLTEFKKTRHYEIIVRKEDGCTHSLF